VQVERAAPPLGSQEGRELEVQVPVFPLLSPASGFIPTTHHLLQLTQHGLGSSPAAAKESIAGLLSPGEGTMQVEPEVDALRFRRPPKRRSNTTATIESWIINRSLNPSNQSFIWKMRKSLISTDLVACIKSSCSVRPNPHPRQQGIRKRR